MTDTGYNLKPYITTPDNAERIADWLRNRGGIAIWQSVFLSHLGESKTTPVRAADGTPFPRPAWWVDYVPTSIMTDPAEVIVSRDVEVKRFHVAVRVGNQNVERALAGEYHLIEYGAPIDERFPVTCTVGSSRRIRAAIARAGIGAYHKIDYATQEAIIMKREWQRPLLEWLAAAPAKLPQY